MRYLWVLMLGGMVLGGCHKEEPPVAVKKDTGRPETRSLEAASAVGYDGKAIRQKVDAALNANDAHNQQVQQQADQ